MSDAVDLVVAQLSSVGYERLPRPLVVAGSTFDFDAAARGTGVSHDLVVIATTARESKQLVQLLSGLNRMLDQIESKRPVSLVLIGHDVEFDVRADLERQARVLPISNDNPPLEEVRHALEVLMPLSLPSTGSQGRDPLSEVTSIIGKPWSAEHQAFLESARSGPDAVREALKRYVDEGALGASGLEGPE